LLTSVTERGLPLGHFYTVLKQHVVIALFLVLIASLVVAALFLAGFLWSVRSDQFEDQDGSAMRMLFDDTPASDIQKHD
jgi:cbb3-type cytochrome oxidase maturation protein